MKTKQYACRLGVGVVEQVPRRTRAHSHEHPGELRLPCPSCIFPVRPQLELALIGTGDVLETEPRLGYLLDAAVPGEAHALHAPPCHLFEDHLQSFHTPPPGSHSLTVGVVLWFSSLSSSTSVPAPRR
jgi:hypothetical protein